MNNNRLKIGEFSRLCKVTVRTLRHYEDIDLLVPEIIDRSTGYRYYAIAQFQKMQSILRLKELGYSLEEIRDLWDDDNHVPSVDSLEEKILACESELERLKERRRIIPSYDDLGRLCYEVIGPEMARIGCECPEPGYCYTIEHGGYKPQDIDIEYCEQVSVKGGDSDIIKFKDIPEVPTAVCMKVFGSYDKLYQSYLELFSWIEKEGYKIIDAPRANYIDGIWNQKDEDKWLTIIQVPVIKL